MIEDAAGRFAVPERWWEVGGSRRGKPAKPAAGKKSDGKSKAGSKAK